MAYVYLKSSHSPKSNHSRNISQGQKRIIAIIFFSFGSILLLSVIAPIVQFQLEYSSKFGQMINPLSAQHYNRSGNILGDLTADYTQLSNWFVDTSANQENILNSTNNQQYIISIPKLKVSDAVVKIGSQDLKNNLIQYPQTALPGQVGSAVVFGHSVLPQFFNPKSYLTIFSTLYRLKTGDEIMVNYDNIDYKYLVEEMYEVQPTDLSVLEQRFDGRYFTLVTCSPPGTYLRRLVVRARLADF